MGLIQKLIHLRAPLLLHHSLQSRQRLDMYLPKNRKKGQKYPVVIFITGVGAAHAPP